MTGISPIAAAKSRHSLAEVVSRTGLVVSAGSAKRVVTARCPMPAHGHYDSTPSLRLDFDQNRWWCFACSPSDTDGTPKAGDVIEWVMQTEQVTWRPAIDILDSGRPLTNAWTTGGTPEYRPASSRRTVGFESPDPGRTPVGRVQHALESAWAFYTGNARHELGVSYLARRGVEVSYLELHNRSYEVGHTPPSRAGLVDWMRGKGFSDDELVDAGLASLDSEGRVTDFYRDRVLLPVRDDQRQLAGFIGRNVGAPCWSKYKNPPRTARYDKSVDLYQPLDRPSRESGRVIVVEGTIDAMAIAVAAIRVGKSDEYCPLTQSGRELSNRQLRRVLALHPSPLIISFDADKAGRESTDRLSRTLTAAGRRAVVADLPDGQDPASWLESRGPRGLSAWDASSSSIQSLTPVAGTPMFSDRSSRIASSQIVPM